MNCWAPHDLIADRLTSAILGSDDPRLRRAQALAVINRTDVTIARRLIRRKLEGQARVVSQLDDDFVHLTSQGRIGEEPQVRAMNSQF